MTHRSAYGLQSAVWLATLAACLTSYAQDDPAVAVALNKNEVYVGEPFLLQIQITNATGTPPPDLSGLSEDFSVEFAGSGQESGAVVMLNGRIVRGGSARSVLNYRVTARRAGQLQLPSFSVNVDGKAFTTQPQAILAREPEPVEGFKLECTFEKDSVYVGEPVLMTSTVYIGERVESVRVSLPMLTSTHFESEAIEPVQKARVDYYDIPVNGERTIAEKGEARLEGKPCLTLTFQHIVVAQKPGELVTPNATATIEVRAGSQRRRTLLDNFSVLGSRVEMRKIIIPSNDIKISAKPLPSENEPPDFSGLVGAYNVSASASPTRVKIGDPITLNIAVEGSYYLRHFDLPPLEGQAQLAKDFDIPTDMAPGTAERDRKVFTQTIRAKRDDVTEIPPIAISYFDTRSGSYTTASSQPIPLDVQSTVVVRAKDADGAALPPVATALVDVDAGIAHNFSGRETLVNQRFGPDVWLRTPGNWLLLLLPPLLYGCFAGAMLYQRFGGFHTEGRNRKLALARLEASLDDSGDTAGDVYNQALDALRVYLGTKLGLNASALTSVDARGRLEREGASESTLAALKSVFDACEAHRYAGGTRKPAVEAEFLASVRECVRGLDREIG